MRWPGLLAREAERLSGWAGGSAAFISACQGTMPSVALNKSIGQGHNTLSPGRNASTAASGPGQGLSELVMQLVGGWLDVCTREEIVWWSEELLLQRRGELVDVVGRGRGVGLGSQGTDIHPDGRGQGLNAGGEHLKLEAFAVLVLEERDRTLGQVNQGVNPGDRVRRKPAEHGVGRVRTSRPWRVLARASARAMPVGGPGVLEGALDAATARARQAGHPVHAQRQVRRAAARGCSCCKAAPTLLNVLLPISARAARIRG